MAPLRKPPPKDMTWAVFAAAAEPALRTSLPAHPGYGAGALEAANEKLAEELASSRGRAIATTTTASELTLSIAEIDERLEAARRKTPAAKAAYDAAKAAEEGLKAQRGPATRREGKVDELKGPKEEKMKRRERALAGYKPPVGVKPAGIRKVVAKKLKKGSFIRA